MRWLVALVFVLALGTPRLVGCGEEPPECRVDEDCGSGFCISGVCAECLTYADCDDQNECTWDGCRSCEDWRAEPPPPGERLCCYNLSKEEIRQGDLGDGRRSGCDLDSGPGYVQGVCVWGSCEENPCDDGNVCTYDWSHLDGSCEYSEVPSGWQPCDWNGEPGLCIEGICKEDLCFGVVCDDGDTCTDDSCDYTDGTCDFTGRDISNGRACTSSDLPSGLCIDGVCQEDLCPEMVCDDGNLCTIDSCRMNQCRNALKDCSDSTVCTDDACDPETGGCIHEPANEGGDCCLKHECVPCVFCWEEPCQDCCGTRCAVYGSCHDGVCGV